MSGLAAPAASEVMPGVLGFLVVAALGLALFFLLRSMNAHLRKVAGGPKWLDQPPEEAPDARDAPTSAGHSGPDGGGR